MHRRQATYRVQARRGDAGIVEAVHHVTVVAWDEELEAKAGGGESPEKLLPLGASTTYYRSGCKPFQLLPLVERGHADRLGFTPREIAVACASHNGEPEHLVAVRAILQAIGLTADHLSCGAHPPRQQADLAAYAAAPSALYNNCSGKHAAMLALAVAEGWPVEDYVDFAHPVQQVCVEAVCELSGVPMDATPIAVDGCSAANPALSLAAVARGYYRFAVAGGDDLTPRSRALERIRSAMAAEPHQVAGSGRLCTDLMRATRGAVVSKTGAEGLQCAALPGPGVGIALKVEDGGDRAKGPALLAFLAENEWLEPAVLAALESWAHPPITSVRGNAVGRLEWSADPIATPA